MAGGRLYTWSLGKCRGPGKGVKDGARNDLVVEREKKRQKRGFKKDL